MTRLRRAQSGSVLNEVDVFSELKVVLGEFVGGVRVVEPDVVFDTEEESVMDP